MKSKLIFASLLLGAVAMMFVSCKKDDEAANRAKERTVVFTYIKLINQHVISVLVFVGSLWVK